MPADFPRTYIIQNDQLLVTEEDHEALNQLAKRFYKVKGYETSDGFDFAESNHPQEQEMYILALEAMYFQRQTGELD